MRGKTESKERIGRRHRPRQEIFEIKRWWKTVRGKPILRSQELGGQQLLPGIPDEITLDLITPKLPWRALHTLLSVSRSWQEVIRTRQVYEARVRSTSTETLIPHPHTEDTMALYSTIEKRCYELPPIPGIPVGILRSSERVALDGKLYVLGGQRILEGENILGTRRGASSRDVYMLDLTRQMGWKQCASMLEARHRFGYGVMDDKIYVFGGVSSEGEGPRVHTGLCIGNTFVDTPGFVNLTSEVYDTQKNEWSSIVPLTRERIDHQIGTVGKELFLYDSSAATLGVYNPAKNDWRSVDRFWEKRQALFITKEKFCIFSQSGIDVYDVEQNSWMSRHANSFATVQPDNSVEISQVSILAVKDELFLEATLENRERVAPVSFHCKGFDSEKTEMVWEEVTCSRGGYLRATSSIQL